LSPGKTAGKQRSYITGTGADNYVFSSITVEKQPVEYTIFSTGCYFRIGFFSKQN